MPQNFYEMQEKIQFAILGCGRIGKRHASMVNINKHGSLACLIDIDKSLHPELEKEFQVPVFSSLAEMKSNNILPDVVNICTPNYLHADQAIEALEMGSNVVVEKPMALSKAKAEDVIHYAYEHNKKVFCVMQNRYSPPSKLLKELIEEKRLGEIYLVNINCFWNRDDEYYQNGDANYWKGKLDKDGGTLFTQFSHFVDIMYWIFGDIKNITARFNDFNHQKTTEFEDSGLIHFDFVKEGSGSINYSTAVWDKNMESSISVIGEKGSIKIGGQYMNEVEFCHIKDYELPKLESTLPPNDYGKYQGSAANHQFVIQNVIDALTKNGKATTNALEGMKVVEIIENIYRLKEK